MQEPRATKDQEPIRVLRLVHELHRRGYQRLRLHIGWSPNGMALRYGTAPADAFEPDGFHMRSSLYPGRAFKSTTGEGPPFGLRGTENADTKRLADAFLSRFRSVASAGRGSDRAYVAWFAALLERCEPDAVPIMFSDQYDVSEGGILIDGQVEPFPVPPPVARDQR